MKEKLAYPTLSQCIILIALYYFLQLIACVIITTIDNFISTPHIIDLFANIAVTITGLLTVYYAFLQDKNSIKKMIYNSDCRYDKGFYAVTLISGVELLVYGFYYLKYPQIAYTILPFNDIDTIIALPFKVLLFPIFEEVIFRGIILNGLSKNYGIPKAIIISSLLFGILHFNSIQSITAFLSGLVLGYIYIITHSLWICAIAHIIKNSLAINNFIHYQLINKLNFTFTTYIITGVILIAAGFYLLNKAYSKQQNEEASTVIKT